MELRPHQEAALERLSNGKILWGGVGTGKSFTAVKYYERREAPRDVYVITTAKKRDSHDWEEEFAHIGVGKEHSVLGGLVVDSWNNLHRFVNVTGAFFIFDEQRLVGGGAWVKAFIKLARRNHWILLSATPGDTWMDYVPVFVANGFYKNRTEFKHEHVVYNTFAKFPKIDRYVGTGKLGRLRREVLVEMPYVRETLRNLVFVDVPYDPELLSRVTKDRWNVYENRPIRDIGELYRVARRVVNSDPRRLAKVAELVRTHPKLIIFYNFDYELELLRSLWHPKSSSTTTSTEIAGANSNSLSLGERHISTATVALERSELWTPSQHGSTGIATAGADGYSSVLTSTALVGGNTQSKRGELWTGDTPSLSPPSSTSGSTEAAESTRLSTSTESTTALGLYVPERSQRSSTNPKKRSRTTSIDGSESGFPSMQNVEDSPTSTRASSIALAEWNGHKHQRIPLEHDRWVYLVQYTAGAEGWNCTETDVMIFYSWNYSYKIWHQAQGRIDRLNTKYRHLTYYVLGGKSWIDLAIKKSLLRKQDFQEKAI